MELVTYRKEYKQIFIDLNIQWIKRYFVPEAADYEILDQVDRLMEMGSMIYFAIEDGQVLATCMAMPLEGSEWELCKLAAVGQYTGKGAGSKVFKACMDFAIAHGAKKITLISNRLLKPALHIYRKFGFQEVPLRKEAWDYNRADIEFVYNVSDADYGAMG